MKTFNLRKRILVRVTLKKLQLVLLLICSLGAVTGASAAQSVARTWDEQILSGIRIDTPHPPAHARNLFSLSVAMYDAWAAYDTNAVGYVYHGKHTAADVLAARNEAISYAAWRMLRERYAYSRNASNTLATLDAKLTSLGFSTNNATRDTAFPAGVGNSVYDAVSAWFINDGARQTNGIPYPSANPPVAYPDYPASQGGYVSVNPAMATGLPIQLTNVVDVNRWQPLAITNGLDQHGFPLGPVQKYLGAQWPGVRPFNLTRTDPTRPWIDPGPPPHLGGVGDADFRSAAVENIRRSSQLTPDDGVFLNISPGAFGNNSLGANDGTGHPVNPATGMAYPSNVVKRGDFGRVLAEFWADGPSSETPPGHWNVLANNVSDNTNFVKRLGGTGRILDDLEWDVKVYFTLNAAVHDAACAAWSAKRFYDGWRPITAIRYMGALGQSTDPTLPSYNTNGLPLIPGLIEIVTPAMAATNSWLFDSVGSVAILAWPGQPPNPTTQYGGVHWQLPEGWITYQKKTFVTPAFPGYFSGHSTFSRAAAEVLAAMTGSPFFPGGLGTFTAVSNTFLTFEKGPSQTVQLQWGTYFDAADQAGISRIFGGIHPSADDLPGRRAGSQCGLGAWALARMYFDGSITKTPIALAISSLGPGGCEVRYNTLRGFFYNLQSTPALSQPFANDPAGFTQAFDTLAVRNDNPAGPGKFYRVISKLTP